MIEETAHCWNSKPPDYRFNDSGCYIVGEIEEADELKRAMNLGMRRAFCMCRCPACTKAKEIEELWRL